jgi:EAL domain-containing protein (putative c-di-GMP-specific phosphodiesterase class I)
MRDLGHLPSVSGSAGRDERGRFAAGNHIGLERAAKHALTAPLRRALEQGLSAAATAVDSPGTGAELARAALTLYRAGKRELQTTSVIACTHLVRWAAQTCAAQHLTMAAARAGLDTELGLRLLERAHDCEGRAERATIAALSLTRALSGQRAESGDDLARLLSEAVKPREPEP